MGTLDHHLFRKFRYHGIALPFLQQRHAPCGSLPAPSFSETSGQKRTRPESHPIPPGIWRLPAWYSFQGSAAHRNPRKTEAPRHPFSKTCVRMCKESQSGGLARPPAGNSRSVLERGPETIFSRAADTSTPPGVWCPRRPKVDGFLSRSLVGR